MLWLIIGLILFLGIHSVRFLAPGVRAGVIDKRGENAWKGMYTVISLLGFVVLVWGYAQARPDAPVVYEPPAFIKHVNLLIMWFAFVIVATNRRPAGRIKKAVKHPMLVATKLWAVGHLLSNGDLASILLFGGFLAWAVADRISLKYRPAETIVEGGARDDIMALVGGTVLYLVFLLWAHQWLFGVAPIA